MEIKVNFKKVRDNCSIPKRKNDNDAGYDCYISLFSDIRNKKLVPMHKNEYLLKPLRRIACHLGFATEIPEGYYAQIVPRSGLALWKGLSIVNSPATIDSGYRGEWIAIVVNLSKKKVSISLNERICQLIIRKLVDFKIGFSEYLSDSDRGKGGFGSSDKKEIKIPIR